MLAPCSSLTDWVTLAKSLNSPEPQFPPLQNGTNFIS